MALFLGLGLTVLGAVCIAAGVQGRGPELYSTLSGGALLGTQVAAADAGYAPGAPAAGGRVMVA